MYYYILFFISYPRYSTAATPHFNITFLLEARLLRPLPLLLSFSQWFLEPQPPFNQPRQTQQFHNQPLLLSSSCYQRLKPFLAGSSTRLSVASNKGAACRQHIPSQPIGDYTGIPATPGDGSNTTPFAGGDLFVHLVLLLPGIHSNINLGPYHQRPTGICLPNHQGSSSGGLWLHVLPVGSSGPILKVEHTPPRTAGGNNAGPRSCPMELANGQFSVLRSRPYLIPVCTSVLASSNSPAPYCPGCYYQTHNGQWLHLVEQGSMHISRQLACVCHLLPPTQS